MRYILSILLVFFFLEADANHDSIPKYMRFGDSLYTFNFRTALDLAKAKEENVLYKIKIPNLEHKIIVQDSILRKLQYRDSLFNVELNHCDNIIKLYRAESLELNKVISNQNLLLLSTDDRLDKAEKKLKRQVVWKNIYKYGYPVAIIAAGILILK